MPSNWIHKRKRKSDLPFLKKNLTYSTDFAVQGVLKELLRWGPQKCCTSILFLFCRIPGSLFWVPSDFKEPTTTTLLSLGHLPNFGSVYILPQLILLLSAKFPEISGTRTAFRLQRRKTTGSWTI